MANYRATGFKKGSGDSGGGFVSVAPTFGLQSDHMASAHVGCTFFMNPKDARLLAVELLKAADEAESTVENDAAEKGEAA